MNNKFDPSFFLDLGSFKHQKIFEVEKVWEALSNIDRYIDENSSEKVTIGENTLVEEGAFIKGPAIIGNNCQIRHGAYIREGVIIGDNVIVGNSVEIKKSIILNNTNIPHFNYIGDSIIGSNVNFGGGAITANFRLDGMTIKIRDGEEKIETNLKKLGAIIGDGCRIGVNSVLNPGTILSKKINVFPLTSVSGFHPNQGDIK